MPKPLKLSLDLRSDASDDDLSVAISLSIFDKKFIPKTIEVIGVLDKDYGVRFWSRVFNGRSNRLARINELHIKDLNETSMNNLLVALHDLTIKPASIIYL